MDCVYLCANRLAPAFAGVEIGIGDSILIKAISQATGRGMKDVRAAMHEQGDLGLVAEASKSTQRTLFQPKPLSVRQVLKGYRVIAKIEGNKSQDKKVGAACGGRAVVRRWRWRGPQLIGEGCGGVVVVCACVVAWVQIGKIKTMLVSCKDAEARFLIRGLQGKLRIGLAEKTVWRSARAGEGRGGGCVGEGVGVLEGSVGGRKCDRERARCGRLVVE